MAPKPGPMKVPVEKLRSVLGVTSVNYVEGKSTLAVVDSPLMRAITQKAGNYLWGVFHVD